MSFIKHLIQPLFIIAIVALFAACSDDSTIECDENTPCKDPTQVCNPNTHTCESTTQSDGSTDSEPTDVGVETSPDSGLPLGASCDNNEACENNQCVDGYCCESACIDECYRCNEIGNEGKCVAYTGGTMRDSECMVDAECQGACANGFCAYVTTDTKACGTPVCNATLDITKVYTNTCKNGACTAVTQDEVTDCKGYLCDATTNDCKTGCKDHSDCAATSVCDRSKAHENADGLGVCLDHNNVTLADSNNTTDMSTELTNAISDSNDTIKTVRMKPGTYEDIEVAVPANKTLRIIGEPGVIFEPAGGKVAFTISGTGRLYLQSIQVGKNTSASYGVYCDGGINDTAVVDIIESLILKSNNTGLTATNCDATIRRSEIRENKGGGLELSKGTFVLTNNLIVGNGSGSSGVGGVKIDSIQTATFIHNTVFGNTSATTAKSGVNCTSTQTLKASLIGNNVRGVSDTSNQVSTDCVLESTQTGDGSTAKPCNTDDSTYLPDANETNSLCINQGNTSYLPIDIESKERQTGNFDLGCYEL